MKEIKIESLDDFLDDLRKKNYDVIISPKKDKLPSFLNQKNFRPDILALSSKGNLVIEVKSFFTKFDQEHIKKMAKTVEEQNGWNFVLFTYKSQKKSENHYLFYSSSIRIGLSKFFELYQKQIKVDYLDPIFLYGWYLLKIVLVAITYDDIMNDEVIFKSALAQGVITETDYTSLSNFKFKAQAITYGHFDVRISKEEVSDMHKLLTNLYNKHITDESYGNI